MSWKYADTEDADFLSKLCKCGHKLDDHHLVYWQLGMSADECEVYGSNETGGMKETWQGKLFSTRPLRSKYRKPPPGPPYTSPWHSGPLRRLVRLVIRGPWWVDHCHHFREEEKP